LRFLAKKSWRLSGAISGDAAARRLADEAAAARGKRQEDGGREVRQR